MEILLFFFLFLHRLAVEALNGTLRAAKRQKKVRSMYHKSESWLSLVDEGYITGGLRRGAVDDAER